MSVEESGEVMMDRKLSRNSSSQSSALWLFSSEEARFRLGNKKTVSGDLIALL
jgi:hypothetical protein